MIFTLSFLINTIKVLLCFFFIFDNDILELGNVRVDYAVFTRIKYLYADHFY